MSATTLLSNAMSSVIQEILLTLLWRGCCSDSLEVTISDGGVSVQCVIMHLPNLLLRLHFLFAHPSADLN